MFWQRLIVINIPRYLLCTAREWQQPSPANRRGCSALIPPSFGSSPLSEPTLEFPHTGFTRGVTTWSLKKNRAAGVPQN